MQVDKLGRFSVKSAYKEFNHSNNQPSCLPWKLIWKVRIPLRVACFTWLVARKEVRTHESLWKKGFHPCSRCYMCGEETATINHLFFFRCKLTEHLGRIFLKLKGIMWVMLRDTLIVLERIQHSLETERKMEDCPCLHLVNSLKREKSKVSWRQY